MSEYQKFNEELVKAGVVVGSGSLESLAAWTGAGDDRPDSQPVNAWVIAVLSLNLGAASIGDAILLGALLWLGFGATFKAAQVAFERRPWEFGDCKPFTM